MLEGLKPPAANKPCIVARKSEGLDKKDREILQEALKDPKWSTNALRWALAGRGFEVSDTALRAHRTEGCSCARKS